MRARDLRRYRLLLRALPEGFRRRHGPAMEMTFAARLAGAGGWWARTATWLREAGDLAWTGLALRLRTTTKNTGEGTMGRRSQRGWADDMASAWRSLRRAPATTVTAIVTLGLGIGAATSLFSAVDRVLIRPVDLPEPDRLVVPWREAGSSFRLSPDREVADQLEATDGVFDRVLRFGAGTLILSRGEEPLPLPAAYTEPGFFGFAGATARAGRLLQASDVGERVVMISEALWSRLGADPTLVGGTLRLDGEPHTVVGVAPSWLRHPSPVSEPPQLWLPLPPGDEGSGRVSAVLARLAPGITLEAARERLAGVNQARREAGATGSIDLLPIAELQTRSLHGPVITLAAAVGLLLALSWASVAGLLLARAEARSREAAVRAALGASAGRLARQQLLEALLLSGAAAVLGVGLARAGLEALRRMRPDSLRFLDGMALDARVLAFAAAAALVATLLFGALPALRSGSGWVAGLLRGARTGAPTGVRARRWIVVGEVALSFTLLVGAVQVAATLSRAAARDTGFRDEGLLAVAYSLPSWRFPTAADRAAAAAEIVERVGALPGVTAAPGGTPPGVGIFFGQLHAEGGAEPDPDAGNEVYFGADVGPGWIETLEVPVLRGRSFTAEDLGEGPRRWILGETLAGRLFPDGDAVGRRIRLNADSDWGTVVGVVGDLLIGGGLTMPDYGQLWMADRAGTTLAVRVSGDPAAAAPAVRAAIREVDPEIPVDEIATVEQHFRHALARERLTAVLLSSFAATAVLLAAVGLYGVLAQVVRLRLPEFGIRLSLGAAPHRVFGAVLRNGGATVLAGLVLGIGGALAGLRLLGSRVPGLEGSDPAAFIAAGALLAAISLFAIGGPALRASRADPVRVLRSE